eukprot:1706875-Rhodomonas_salina.4
MHEPRCSVPSAALQRRKAIDPTCALEPELHVRALRARDYLGDVVDVRSEHRFPVHFMQHVPQCDAPRLLGRRFGRDVAHDQRTVVVLLKRDADAAAHVARHCVLASRHPAPVSHGT